MKCTGCNDIGFVRDLQMGPNVWKKCFCNIEKRESIEPLELRSDMQLPDLFISIMNKINEIILILNEMKQAIHQNKIGEDK
jgi:hypothetical protein